MQEVKFNDLQEESRRENSINEVYPNKPETRTSMFKINNQNAAMQALSGGSRFCKYETLQLTFSPFPHCACSLACYRRVGKVHTVRFISTFVTHFVTKSLSACPYGESSQHSGMEVYCASACHELTGPVDPATVH